MVLRRLALSIPALLLSQSLAHDPAGQAKPRARDLGVALDGTTGPLNAITDVQGVEVGYATLVSGEGRRDIGKGPVRTGVTAILPRGRGTFAPVFAAFASGNGNGDMTGTHWIEESGVLETPIMITNTLSVGVVRDAVVSWMVKKGAAGGFWYPVVAETSDGRLNDQKGQHVKAEDAVARTGIGAGRPAQRRQRRRRHRHALSRLQGGNRHCVADAAREWRLYRGRTGSVQLRLTLRASHRGDSGWSCDPGIRAVRGSTTGPAAALGGRGDTGVLVRGPSGT